MTKTTFHDDDSVAPDIDKEWLLSNDWIQACCDHYERAWREINDGPLKELEPYCAKFLKSRWHLPTLLARVLMLAPTGKLDYLKRRNIALRGIAGGAVLPRHHESEPNLLEWRRHLYESALSYAASISEINRSESANLAVSLWQTITSRRKIFRVPAILAQTRPETNDGETPVTSIDYDCIVGRSKALLTSQSQWGVVGPPWFEEIVTIDKNVCSQNRSNAENLVVGIDSSSRFDDLAAATREWKRSNSVFIWFLDESIRTDLLPLMENCWTAVVTGGDYRWLVKNWPNCSIQEYEPMVQPLLHNPIGWWNGNQGTRGEMENDFAIPRDWVDKFWEARGYPKTAFASKDEGFKIGTTKPITLQYIQREQNRLRACRDVIQRHCVSERLTEFRSLIEGGSPVVDRPALVSAVVATMRPERLPALIEMIENQVYPSLELILVLNRANFDQTLLSQLQDNMSRTVRILRGSDTASLGELLSMGCDHAEGAYIAKMDDDDYYGPNFLADQVMCLEFSHARVVGKTRSFIHFRSDERFYLRDNYDEFEYAYNSPRGGTIMFHREVLRYVGWRCLSQGEDVAFIDDCRRFLIPVVSSDMFNYAHTRRDVSEHTWQVDRAYFQNKATDCASELTLNHITC